MEIEINYDHDVFDLKVDVEGELYNIKSDEPINVLKINSLVKEIQNKNFIIKKTIDQYEFDEKIVEENVNFEQLKKNIVKTGIIKIKVLDPENIIEINGINKLDILAKEVKKYIPEIFELFIKKFDYAKKYSNYESFIKFFKYSLDNKFRIVESDEFSGRLLKFYKDSDKLVKAFYIMDENIQVLDSLSGLYKELELGKIKESLENLNNQLKLEGKKTLELEFK